MNISIIKNCRKKTLDISRHVLDLAVFKFTHHPQEKPFLFDVDDSFGGNDPHIEIIIYPDKESIRPHKQAEKGDYEHRDRITIDAVDCREYGRKNKKTSEQNNSQKNDHDKLLEDVKPMAMNDLDHLLALIYFIEVFFSE